MYLRTYLNTYESQRVHSNLNIKYGTIKPKIKNIWQISNSNKFYHQKGITPNLYYKSRINSKRYNKDKEKSSNYFKKIFSKDSTFLKAITTKPNTANGRSKNTYLKCYKLLERSESYTLDNVKRNQKYLKIY